MVISKTGIMKNWCLFNQMNTQLFCPEYSYLNYCRYLEEGISSKNVWKSIILPNLCWSDIRPFSVWKCAFRTDCKTMWVKSQFFTNFTTQDFPAYLPKLAPTNTTFFFFCCFILRFTFLKSSLVYNELLFFLSITIHLK